MNGFLAELGKKLAERWVQLLLLPGALWVAAALIAWRLGHAHAVDVTMLRKTLDAYGRTPGNRSVGSVLLTVVALLTLAAAAGLTAAALGAATQRLRALPGNRGLPRWIAAYRQGRWDTITDRYRQLIADTAGGAGPRDAERRLAILRQRRVRMGASRPKRPTWVADRFLAANRRAESRFGLDLGLVWPRLWALLPDPLRGDLTAAQDGYAAASRLVGWAVLYLGVAIWWWPALLIVVTLGIVGEVRARTAAAALTDLIDTSVDLHAAPLAEKVGVTVTLPFTADHGRQVMKALGAPQSTA
jgi:hypothetical protein